jgi:hypothetical protein
MLVKELKMKNNVVTTILKKMKIARAATMAFAAIFFSLNIFAQQIPFSVRENNILPASITTLQNSASDTKNMYRLQVLYVIPKGQTAKPRANQAIAAIMSIIQKHYLEQLGVTFELDDPLVTQVNITQDAKYAEDWTNNAALVKSHLADSYLNRKNVVFSIIEGTSGSAGGAWNIVKMTSGFWNTSYDTYINKPHLLPQQLLAWSHKLGLDERLSRPHSIAAMIR